MRSIILKIHQTITKGMDVNLFKSHNKNYKNGEQLRDFIYVKDVVSIIEWFLDNSELNGLFNVGTGIPRSFNDIAKAVFSNSNKKRKKLNILILQLILEININTLQKQIFKKLESLVTQKPFFLLRME